ncbi:hypothetical protein [Microlunatus sp. Gsoil 973]|uniref:hypothetical protein n=1 Tax=Microlunatus sp. Gsoil 973 TaxID=2672569 RepID=UPI0012B4E979|nr:hypothetical protein [Microlunatus sp. Gsoil 973]QGN33490.1 hypothetical protein GJV80_12465 [Microlunatus sp. Gsoil 973]
MATWDDVAAIAATLPGAVEGRAPDDAPTYDVGRHPFTRLRWDERGREILQFWTMEPDTEEILAGRRDVFFRIDRFRVKATVLAWLDRLDEQELAEILAESHRARRGVRTG